MHRTTDSTCRARNQGATGRATFALGLFATAALFSTGLAHSQEGAPLLVPPGGSSAVLDGLCGDYLDGVSEPFDDAGGFSGTVHLKHDGTSLWVCVDGAPGLDIARNVTLYLDPQGDGGPFTTHDDAALEVRIENGLRSSARGDDGSGSGFVPRPGLTQLWNGTVAVGAMGDSVEFAVSISGLQVGACGGAWRLAIGHRGVAAPGDDYFWPEAVVPGAPETWRGAVLEMPPCACGGTFRTLADSEIREGDPDAAFGDGLELLVGRDPQESRTLLAFDVTASIPPRATVDRAVLELALDDVGAGGSYTLEARRLDDPWDEPAVTWNAQPLGERVYATAENDLTNGLLTLDVTPLVRGWATRGIGEQSLMLTTPTDGALLYLASREAGGELGESRIRIQCSPEARDPRSDRSAADAAQRSDMQRLQLESLDPVTIALEQAGGGVRSATFALPIPDAISPDGATRARWFLDNYRDLMRTPDPASSWQLVRRLDDDRHLHFRQRHAGIPVFPSSLALWMDGSHVLGVSGRYVPDIARDPEPRVSAAEAEAAASGELGSKPIGKSRLVYLNRGLLGADDPTTYLAWAVSFQSETVYIDADSGAVLERLSETHDAAFRISDADGDGPSLPVFFCLPDAVLPGFGPPWELWFTNQGAVSSNVDAEGWTAFSSITTVEAYWRNTLNRDSYDGHGSPIWMYIHVGTPASWGTWPNAQSRSKCNLFEYSDSAAQLDVVGHEFTHAVTRYTAGLVYQNQSGALNESFSDVFGQRVDDANWTMGEGIVVNGPWRDLSAPLTRGQPDLFSNYQTLTTDNGGVHTNSGIPNKAFHLAVEGGVHYGYPVDPIGEKKAENLWAHVLWGHLGSGSQFLDAQKAFVAAAGEYVKGNKLSFNALNACSVRNAWSAVGLGTGDIDCDGTPDSVDPDQDGDGIADFKDNCVQISNTSQQDTDGDGVGNFCDPDDDGDGRVDTNDNCQWVANFDQANNWGGAAGDACEDSDGDGVIDQTDNCPVDANADQADADGDSRGDACDNDIDGDFVPNVTDNCPHTPNTGQQDGDQDNVGDACDHCPGFAAADNTDTDNDGKGNPCDDDDDNDGVTDIDDNCPLVANAAQIDTDNNGLGMLCDDSEQHEFRSRLYTGLTVPATFPGELDPFVVPLPIGPADGPVDLPPGMTMSVEISLPFSYVAQITGDDGTAWTMQGPVEGLSSLAFSPPAHGGTRFTLASRGAAGSVPAGLLVAPPDQLRFSLMVLPTEPVDPSQTFDLFLRQEELQSPDLVSRVVADSCSVDGESDGSVGPGEDAILAIGLGLDGVDLAAGASAVSGSLVTTTPGVTVTRSEASFPDVPAPGGARSLDPQFAFSVDASVACGTPIDFALTVRTGTTAFVRNFSLPLGGVAFAASQDTPLPLADLGTVVSTLDVQAAGTVGDVDVTVWIDHGQVGELQLTLVNPLGFGVPLIAQRGFGADLAGTTFDDDADRAVADGQAPFAARFRPETPMSTFAGVPAQGTWMLQVSDDVTGSSGQLDAWSLEIALDDPSCNACSVPSPGEVDDLVWLSSSELEWSAAPAAGWYNVYEGLPEDWPALLDGRSDACLRWQGTQSPSGATLTETPDPGSVAWYLVRAANAGGEGPAGSATAGARVQDSTGECP